MYNMSQAFNAAFASATRARPIARATIGATTYTTEDNQIADMTLKESLGDGNGTLPLGETGSAELRLTLSGVSADGLSGLTVTPSMTLQGRNDWCPLGVFRVESISSPDNYDTIELTCYDAMYYADRTTYRSSLTYPATLQAVYNEVLTQAGMRGESGNVIAGFTVQTEPQGYSCRQMLGYIAGICGGCARMSRNGRLEIVRFAVVSASAASIDGVQQYDDSGSLDHNTDVQIQGLQVTCGDKIWQYSGGNDSAIATYDASAAQDRSVLANVYERSDGSYQIEISGSGTMYDYASRAAVPWRDYLGNMTSFVVQDGITSIGAYAANQARNLTNISIADTVTSIGAYAFAGCTALTYVYISEGVTAIGTRAFNGCSLLDTVYLPNGLLTIGNSAFRACTLLGKSNPVVLPNSLTTLGQYAFAEATNLGSVQFSSGLTSIGAYAFQSCAALRLANLASCANLATIGSYAFAGCTSLTAFVGGGTAALGADVFRGDTALASVTLSDRCTGIGDRAFYGCSALATLALPDSITALGGQIITGTAITALTLPAGVTSVSTGAYGTLRGATYLRTVAVDTDNNAYHTHDGCLYAGAMLVAAPEALTATSVSVEDGCTSIALYALSAVQHIEDISVPASVTNIGGSAFNSLSILSITIDKAQDGISGSPWGATNATVAWTGGE